MFRSSITGRFVSKLWARWFPWFVVEEKRRAIRVEDLPDDIVGAIRSAKPRKWDDFKIGGSE